MSHPHPVRALLVRCVLLTGFALVAAAAIVAVHPANDWMASYADKVRRLEDTPGQRMIFVGGSGLAFGLNSTEVEEAFHIAVVNTGVHAGLGLRFMLAHVRPFVRAGDVVVVIPEYGLLRGHNAEDRELWAEALLSDMPESLHGARIEDLPNVLGGFPPYAEQKLLIDPIRARGFRHAYVSSRAAFDALGDEVGHLSAAQPEHAFYDRFDTDVDGSVALLLRFATELEADGVRVIVAFQAIDASVFNENRQAIALIAGALRKALGNRVIGTPEEGALPDAAIFDTPNHANAAGREQNTARLLRQIGHALTTR